MQSIKIYHNPRCSKSRQTLQLLQEHGCKPDIIEYLKTPMTLSELKKIIKLLGISSREIMRSNEAIYKTQQLADDDLTDTQLLQAIIDNPILLQRPIVVCGDKAVIGRPPENVLKIIA